MTQMTKEWTQMTKELTGNAVEFFKLEATLAWGRVTGMVHPDQEPPIMDSMNKLWGGMTEDEQADARRRVDLYMELFPPESPKSETPTPTPTPEPEIETEPAPIPELKVGKGSNVVKFPKKKKEP